MYVGQWQLKMPHFPVGEMNAFLLVWAFLRQMKELIVLYLRTLAMWILSESTRIVKTEEFYYGIL